MKKVLIVDDVALNIIVAQKMLSLLPFEFDKANNGEDGMKKIIEFQPDLLLLDLLMPVCDGFKVIEEIRAGRCGNPDLPIIVLSALNGEADVTRALEMGANDFVTKPILMNHLIEVVKKTIDIE